MDNSELEKRELALQLAKESVLKDSHKYALKNPLKLDPEMLSLVCNQLEFNSKIIEKNADWLGFIAPQKLALEQASSKITAEYKANLIKGNSVLDLTGGLGMDSFYFSQQFAKVYYNEIQKDLFDIVKQNIKNNNIEFFNEDSTKLLAEWPIPVDLIYIDPARRNDKNEKLVLIEDCQPNVVELQDLIFEKAQKIMIKFSPMLDIKSALDKLKGIEKVYVIALENELKELLFIGKKNTYTEPILYCVNINNNSVEEFNFTFNQEKNANVNYSSTENYVYLPNKSITKAGAFKIIAQEFNLKKIAPNTHLYTSKEKIDNFPGRIFEVMEDNFYKKKEFNKEVKDKNLSVFTRNFGETAQNLKTLHGFKENQNKFICFYKNLENKKKYLILNKIN